MIKASPHQVQASKPYSAMSTTKRWALLPGEAAKGDKDADVADPGHVRLGGMAPAFLSSAGDKNGV